MRQSKQAEKKVYAISLGCPKNLVDTERFLGKMVGLHYRVVDDPRQADILFLNTCAFIADAVVESRNFLGELSALKERHPGKKIYLAGCLVSREGDKLREEFPLVDRLIRPEQLNDLRSRLLTTPNHYGYLKISEGCNNRCRYCLIPSLRGPLKSFPRDRLLAEAAVLAAGGVKELNVVAQDTTAYGTDLYGEPMLASLLEDLCRLEKLRWVRLLYTYPSAYTDRLVKVIAGHLVSGGSRICPYLDIPLQHASDRVLKLMGRRGNSGDYRRLVDKLRAAIPGLVIRTTFIVGFPGETARDFKLLKDFVTELAFEKLGIFAFSPEEGVPAAGFPNPVPEAVKEERLAELAAIQQKISRRKLAGLLGRELEVLVDGVDPENRGRSVGRSWYEAPEVDGTVFLDRTVPAGGLVKVRVTGITDYDLEGRVL